MKNKAKLAHVLARDVTFPVPKDNDRFDNYAVRLRELTLDNLPAAKHDYVKGSWSWNAHNGAFDFELTTMIGVDVPAVLDSNRTVYTMVTGRFSITPSKDLASYELAIEMLDQRIASWRNQLNAFCRLQLAAIREAEGDVGFMLAAERLSCV